MDRQQGGSVGQLFNFPGPVLISYGLTLPSPLAQIVFYFVYQTLCSAFLTQFLSLNLTALSGG